MLVSEGTQEEECKETNDESTSATTTQDPELAVTTWTSDKLPNSPFEMVNKETCFRLYSCSNCKESAAAADQAFLEGSETLLQQIPEFKDKIEDAFQNPKDESKKALVLDVRNCIQEKADKLIKIQPGSPEVAAKSIDEFKEKLRNIQEDIDNKLKLLCNAPDIIPMLKDNKETLDETLKKLCRKTEELRRICICSNLERSEESSASDKCQCRLL